MSKKLVYNKFNRGEIYDKALARDDVDKVTNSASEMTNFIPSRLGGMQYRPGFEYVGDCYGSSQVKIFPFTRNVNDQAILEFTNAVMRVWLADTSTTVPATDSIVTYATNAQTIASDDPQNFTKDSATKGGAEDGAGTTVYISKQRDGSDTGQAGWIYNNETVSNVAHAIKIVVSEAPVTIHIGDGGSQWSDNFYKGVLKPGTHVIVVTPTTTNLDITFSNDKKYRCAVDSIEVLSNTDLELATAVTSDFRKMRMVQVNDICYFTYRAANDAKTNEPFQIERRGTTSWSLVNSWVENGPFEPVNTSSVTMQVGTQSGNIAIIPSRKFFTDDYIGSLMKIGSNGQYASQTETTPTTSYTESILVSGSGNGRKFDAIRELTGSRGTSTVVLQSSVDDTSWADIKTFTDLNSQTTFDDGLDGTDIYYRLQINMTATPTQIIASLDYSGGSVLGIGKILNLSSDATDGNYLVNNVAGYSEGDTSIVIGTGTGTISAGDVVEFASDGNYYVVKTGVSGPGTIVLHEPGLHAAIADTDTVTVSDIAVHATALKPFGKIADPITSWYEGAWSKVHGYPTAVDIYEGRLWYGGDGNVWASESDSYDSFDRDIEGDSKSIFRTMAFAAGTGIYWLSKAIRLIAGTAVDEVAIRSTSFNEILTQDNCNLRSGGGYGSSENCPPLSIDDTLYFTARTGQKIIQLGYDSSNDGQSAVDLMTLHPYITADAGSQSTGEIYSIAMTRHPETRLWAASSTGNLIVYAVDQAEDVGAWSRVTLGGSETVDEVLTLSGTTEDRVYTIVKNGSVYSLCKMAPFDTALGGTLSYHVDMFEVQASTTDPVTVGSQIANSTTVRVWANGVDLGEFTTNGSNQITLGGAKTNVTIGLPYNGDYVSNKLSGTQYSLLNDSVKIDKVGMILRDTVLGTLQTGYDFSNLFDMPYVDTKGATQATVVNDFDELPMPFDGSFGTDSRVYLRAKGPCTILALTYVISEGDDKTRTEK